MTLPSAFQSGTAHIDITAPGGIDRLLDFHRQTFGTAVMEATGDAPPAADAPAADAPPAAPTPGLGGAVDKALGAPAADAPKADDDGGDPWADPVKAKAEIERLRRENGAERTNAKKTAAEEAAKGVLDTISVALGLKQGDKAPTADELAAQLAAQSSEANLAKIELAVFRAASSQQGDPSALLDSRTFLASVKDLDPSDKGFQSKVDDAIKKALADNPKLKAVQAAAASAVDHAGGTGEKPARPSSLSAAVDAAYAKR